MIDALVVNKWSRDFHIIRFRVDGIEHSAAELARSQQVSARELVKSQAAIPTQWGKIKALFGLDPGYNNLGRLDLRRYCDVVRVTVFIWDQYDGPVPMF